MCQAPARFSMLARAPPAPTYAEGLDIFEYPPVTLSNELVSLLELCTKERETFVFFNPS